MEMMNHKGKEVFLDEDSAQLIGIDATPCLDLCLDVDHVVRGFELMCDYLPGGCLHKYLHPCGYG